MGQQHRREFIRGAILVRGGKELGRIVARHRIEPHAVADQCDEGGHAADCNNAGSRQPNG